MNSWSFTSFACWLVFGAIVAPAGEGFEGFINKGLVGVGRLAADQLDRTGNDTLGGVFSGMAFDLSSWQRSGTAQAGFTYAGTLYGLADRGFGDGAFDYRPRVHTFQVELSPFYSPGRVSQDQITLTLRASTLLTYHGQYFTGFDASDTNRVHVPHSSLTSPGNGRRAVDSEGFALAPDGGYFVSDEYGPIIYQFDAAGDLRSTFLPPHSVVPTRGDYPGWRDFSAMTPPDNGRRNNRGFEGLTISPDGKWLTAVLQSPLIQDSGPSNFGRFIRLLQYDVDVRSESFGHRLAEFVFPLTSVSNSSTDDYTVVSEVLALDSRTYLLLERDGFGLGAETNTPSRYKRIILASAAGATNLVNTAYDHPKGAPGHRPLGDGPLPATVRPLARRDWIDLLNPADLARFGLNLNAKQDRNTLSEKWEGMALMPMDDREHPNDYFLFVGNDNDFSAEMVYHNGNLVATNAVEVDTMILAYRVTLPGYQPPLRPRSLGPPR